MSDEKKKEESSTNPSSENKELTEEEKQAIVDDTLDEIQSLLDSINDGEDVSDEEFEKILQKALEDDDKLNKDKKHKPKIKVIGPIGFKPKFTDILMEFGICFITFLAASILFKIIPFKYLWVLLIYDFVISLGGIFFVMYLQSKIKGLAVFFKEGIKLVSDLIIFVLIYLLISQINTDIFTCTFSSMALTFISYFIVQAVLNYYLNKLKFKKMFIDKK